jgi:prophage tail gpP-like protein
MLSIKINNAVFEGFTEASVTKTMQALCGQFEFKAGGDLTYARLQELGLIITKASIVEILADGQKIMTGYIEQQDISYSNNTYSITIAGREITCDIVDCRVSATFTNTSNTSLIDLIQAVFNNEGLNYTIVDKSTTAVTPFQSTDFQISTNGESVIDFLNKYALKKYVMLLTDENGNFELANSGSDLSNSGKGSEQSSYLITNEIGLYNNIWRATVSYDQSQLYNTYTYLGIPNYNDVTTQGQVPRDQSFIAYTGIPDSNIREGRNYVEVQSESYSVQKLKERVSWKMETQIANSRKYSVTLGGHSFIDSNGDDVLLKINQLIKVVDDTCGIDEIMLIESLNYRMDINGNSLTVVLVQKDAYNLRAENEILSNPYYGTAFNESGNQNGT